LGKLLNEYFQEIKIFMINIQYLVFAYPSGEFCLNISELSISQGERVAFVGPSGCGKTTLLNLVAGILLPKNGSVMVGDEMVSGFNDTARRIFRISNIGFIFQDFGLLDYLDVLDNILHPYRITDVLTLNSDVRDRAVILAEQMGIADMLQQTYLI
jgi:putative ABC transport system ATP-binding protein